MTDHQRDTEEQEFKDFMESMSLTGFPIAVGRMARRGAEQIRTETEQSRLGQACMRLATRVETFLGDTIQRIHH
jgi:hypothetical protein